MGKKDEHSQSLFPYFNFFSLKLGSCWASEKGGDFLLDKHVINLREHILSHRKITEGEMSGVVTQADPLDCCDFKPPPPTYLIQNNLPTCIINKQTCPNFGHFNFLTLYLYKLSRWLIKRQHTQTCFAYRWWFRFRLM